jgi:hypothetical protein
VLDLDAVDHGRLPVDLLDPKICRDYLLLVLGKRNNRLIIATTDPTDQEASEKIKFTTELGVDWIIAEYDKLGNLLGVNTKSVAEMMGGGDESEDGSEPDKADADERLAGDVARAHRRRNVSDKDRIITVVHKDFLGAYVGLAFLVHGREPAQNRIADVLSDSIVDHSHSLHFSQPGDT